MLAPPMIVLKIASRVREVQIKQISSQSVLKTRNVRALYIGWVELSPINEVGRELTPAAPWIFGA